jgi:heme-degrading monooxygenase HmoA
MIARIWHGVTEAAKADEYLGFLNRTGVPDYQATTGNQGVYIFRKIEDDRARFLLLTLWDSEEAIKRFAGPEFQRAKYYPDDKKFLLEFEPTVQHYEVLVQKEK